MKITAVQPESYMQCLTFLVEGPSGAILIDPGSGCMEKELLANLSKTGCPAESLKGILLTHCHADHAMGAGRLRQKFGTPIYSSRKTAEFLHERSSRIWGEHPELIPQINVDFKVDDSETLTLAGLKVLCVVTPGHTPGCMSYLVETEEGRMIGFTGDLLMPEYNCGWNGDPDFSTETVLASIRRLMKLSIDIAYPGHGRPVTDVSSWLDKSLQLGMEGKWTFNNSYNYWNVPESLKIVTAENK